MDPRMMRGETQGSNETERPLVDDRDSSEEEEEDDWDDETPLQQETRSEFWHRQYRNVVHFFVEDWFLSAMLGIITAILSICVDVAIEYLRHYKIVTYEWADEMHVYGGFVAWVLYITACTAFASLVCHAISKQAVGSGIPEVKVIMHGFAMKNYLSFRTLVAKVVGLTFALGGGLPIGKEGPFVHMGAIVAALLNKVTSACNYNVFFSNEGRIMEMLSSGCAVGIACTFSAPAGGVLYGIESTSKYFAVKNYWRSFFATTCSAIIFRFAMAFIIPPHIAGTITAYYQTSFPNEVFLVEEIPLFILLGAMCGLAAAVFVWLHRQFALFMRHNKMFLAVFAKSPVVHTALWAVIVGVVTFPEGLGRICAGHLSFREALIDFFYNCTLTLHNQTVTGCPSHVFNHWTTMGTEQYSPLFALCGFFITYFLLVAVCTSLYLPSGIFVPSFVIGAAAGRIVGEIVTMWWPEGIRGLDNPQIYPGLYAVVGAAAYTGAVTHSLSIAVIVCETTGQLSALLPVLIALMVANAIASFLQPSIYESIILVKGYPYLADLPPSRVSVHTMKVEKVMVKDIVYITRETTYKELRTILTETPTLSSYPFVTDKHSMTLLGSVSRKYLTHLMLRKLGPDPSFNYQKRRSITPSEILSTLSALRRNSQNNVNNVNRGGSLPGNRHSWTPQSFLTDRNISGNTLLAHSPLHENQGERGPLAPLLMSQNEPIDENVNSLAHRAATLASPLDLDDVAIDPAPFQLVKGTSLYKVHTLFSLLALNHAYVTEKGKLIGVLALKELREALANIYTRGAVAPKRKKTGASMLNLPQPANHSSEESTDGQIVINMPHSRGVVINEGNNVTHRSASIE